MMNGRLNRDWRGYRKQLERQPAQGEIVFRPTQIDADCKKDVSRCRSLAITHLMSSLAKPASALC